MTTFPGDFCGDDDPDWSGEELHVDLESDLMNIKSIKLYFSYYLNIPLMTNRVLCTHVF